MDILDELDAAQAKLLEHKERAARQLTYRDDVIARAIAEGITWRVLQERIHVHPNAIRLALERHARQ